MGNTGTNAVMAGSLGACTITDASTAGLDASYAGNIDGSYSALTLTGGTASYADALSQQAYWAPGIVRNGVSVEVTATLGARQVFHEWECNPVIAFTPGATSSPATFTMPGTALAVEAKYYTAPTVEGHEGATDTITLEPGYSAFTKTYAITGDGPITVSLAPGSDDPGVNLTTAGLLSIPTGIAPGRYKVVFELANGVLTPATLTVDIKVKDTFDVTLSASPAEGGSVSGGGTFVEDADCTAVAVANTGYTFSHWQDGTQQVSTSATYTFTVDRAHSLMAHFTKDTNPSSSTPPSSSDTPPSSSSGYTTRTLRHEATGVTVKVNCATDAMLVITQNHLHDAGTCTACDEIRTHGSPVALYDISISGGYDGKLEVRIPVGSGYNGQNMSLWHCKSDHVEKLNSKASGNYVAGTFSSLSPFAVFTGESADSGGAPQTGDSSSLWVWLVLAGSSLCILAGAGLLWRRKRHKASGTQ